MSMTDGAALFVRGVGVWTPEAPTLERYLTRDHCAVPARPSAELLPARLRGRASPLTAMLANVVAQATRAAGVDPGKLPYVFGSAYGEMHTTLALLEQLWTSQGVLSPAKFQASVHNTAAAQLSIALGNRAFSTSLAAGHDTVAAVLIEARAWLARHPGQVLVACADEAPSEALQPGLAYPPLAAAFVLDNVTGHGLARIEAIEWVEHADPRETARVSTENPVACALALAAAVFSGARTALTVQQGSTLGYRILVDARATGGAAHMPPAQ
jgi:hypothetical protein